jgi:hypothetical protein
LIPWSRTREVRYWWINLTGILMLTFGAGFAGGAMIVHKALPGWLGVILLFAGFSLTLWVRDEIRQMETNRPIDPSRLTIWKFWPPETDRFRCNCGQALSFANATFHPTEKLVAKSMTHSGPGRWVVNCADCGRGHYKFASPTAKAQ